MLTHSAELQSPNGALITVNVVNVTCIRPMQKQTDKTLITFIGQEDGIVVHESYDTVKQKLFG